MTSVEFHNFRSNDAERSFTLEDAWQRFGAWAGLHDYAFNDTLALDSQVVTGVLDSDWTTYLLSAALPPSFSVRYHAAGAAALKVSSDSFDYTIGVNASGHPTVWSGTSIVQQVPNTAPAEADVEVVVRQQSMDDTGTNLWLTLTLYMNGAWQTSYSNLIDATAASVSASLAVFDDDEVTFTAIRIPELCETTEFGTLDPGETAFSGLQRTIEGRYLHYFSRYDGSLRVWRKRDRDSDLTFGHSVLMQRRTSDLTQLLTHARMMGAYIWGEASDASLLAQYGHRFNEVNNPNLLTEEECDTEAANTLKRSEERAFGLSFQAQHVPTLEPEDRIEVDGDSWILNDYSFDVSEGQIVQTYNGRRYVWGTS